MSVASGILGATATKKTAEAQNDAAKLQAQAEEDKLDYLKEQSTVPTEFRDQALAGLGSIFGMSHPRIEYSDGTFKTSDRTLGVRNRKDKKYYIPEGEMLPGQEWKVDLIRRMEESGGQQGAIDRAISSPLYQEVMGGKEAGEDAILRHAGMTGGLRSGNVQENMYDYNIQLQNAALLSSYEQEMQGLYGMAGLDTNVSGIANSMTNAATTRGLGSIAAAGTTAGMYSNIGQNNIAAVGMGLQAYNTYSQPAAAASAGSAASAAAGPTASQGNAGFWSNLFSDRLLKSNIKKVFEIDGYNFYTWTWNSVAQMLGLYGKSVGCLADEVFKKRPDCVTLKDGFLFVLYSRLNLSIPK